LFTADTRSLRTGFRVEGIDVQGVPQVCKGEFECMRPGVCAESPIGESEDPDLLPQALGPAPARAPPAPWSGGAAIAVWLVSLALSLALGVVLELLQILTGVTIPLILITIVGELGFLAPPVFYAAAKGRGLRSLGFRLRGSLKAAALGLVIAFPAWLVYLAVSIPITSILPPPEWLVDVLQELSPQTPLELLLIVLATLMVVAPSEELLSRGFVQQGMENSLGRKRGLLISSVLFGILHLNPWQGVGAFFVALLFGYFFQKVGYNLVTPITAHAVLNSISFALGFLKVF